MLIPYDEGRRYARKTVAGERACPPLSRTEQGILGVLGVDEFSLSVIGEIMDAYEAYRRRNPASEDPEARARPFVELLKPHAHVEATSAGQDRSHA